jgi:hypothetical protein
MQIHADGVAGRHDPADRCTRRWARRPRARKAARWIVVPPQPPWPMKRKARCLLGFPYVYLVRLEAGSDAPKAQPQAMLTRAWAAPTPAPGTPGTTGR